MEWDKGLGPCTLICIDPDAPHPKGDGTTVGSLGPWLHWLVVNAESQPENGQSVVEYMGPTPPSGMHRYIFVLFQQRDADAEVNVPCIRREKWDLKGFLKANPGLNANKLIVGRKIYIPGTKP